MGAGTLTVIGKNEALDLLVVGNTTLYLGLLTNGTEETGAGVGGTAYARQPITWNAASGGIKTNSLSITFDNGGATDWGNTLNQWGIYDALTAGNQLASGVLDGTRNMSLPGAVLIFDVGDVVLTLSD